MMCSLPPSAEEQPVYEDLASKYGGSHVQISAKSSPSLCVEDVDVNVPRELRMEDCRSISSQGGLTER